jgi:serine protease Do
MNGYRMKKIAHPRLNGLTAAMVIVVLGICAGTAGLALAQTQMIPATFSEVAQKASPAVVNISTVKVVKEGGDRTFRFHGPRDPNTPGDPFQEFFERFFREQMPRRDHKENSLGSGFIIEPTGVIITNNHVVEDADEIVVKLSDGRELKAEVLGRDPKTDLAVIKIKDGTGAGFPYLNLGDSRATRVGDWVVAIGNPFGLEHTVTAGILSAKGRVIGAGPYDDFLQTDASINFGNSGGPLLNLDGEVIGINTAIVAGGTGIGFAIPTSLANDIIKQLKDKGRVVRGWLGVMIQKITPGLAESFGLKDEKGALVADVTSGGPAEKAGIKRGDVIVSFDGKDIKDWSDLPTIVAATPVGKRVEVKVIREGKEKSFNVTIAELDDEKLARGSAPTDSKVVELGLTVQELTPEIAERLGLSEQEGVVVSGVEDESPASEAGLRPGDLILEINRVKVNNVNDYRRVVRDVDKGEMVLFLVKRGSNTLFFTMKTD